MPGFFQNSSNITITNGQFTNVEGDALIYNTIGRLPGQSTTYINGETYVNGRRVTRAASPAPEPPQQAGPKEKPKTVDAGPK